MSVGRLVPSGASSSGSTPFIDQILANTGAHETVLSGSQAAGVYDVVASSTVYVAFANGSTLVATGSGTTFSIYAASTFDRVTVVPAAGATTVSIAADAASTTSTADPWPSYLPKSGYWVGGAVNSGATTDIIDRLDFASDTTATEQPYVIAITGAPGYANSGIAGYVTGGVPTSGVDLTYGTRFAFPTMTRSTYNYFSSVNFGESVSVTTAAANSGVAGYLFGARNQAGNLVNRVMKHAFSTDVITSVGAALTAICGRGGSLANSGVAAYHAFGENPGGTKVVTVNKFAFSTETASALGTGLSTARSAMATFANSGTAGYFAGGQTSNSVVTTVDKYAFSNDARSTLGTGLSQAGYQAGGVSNSGTAGYVNPAEGTSSTINTASIDKFAYSNDARTTLSATLAVSRRASQTSFANSGTL